MKSFILPTIDNYPLSVSLFQPKTKPILKKVIIINSATGIRQKFYFKIADFLSENGYHVITYDYRGIGDSKPKTLKGFECDFVTWGKLDFHSIIQYCINTFFDCKILAIGHSIGGTIIGMTPLSSKIDCIILIGAQTSYYKDWKKNKISMYTMWHIIMPFLSSIFGYFPGKYFSKMEDLPFGVVKQWHQRRLESNMENQLTKQGIELFFNQYKNHILILFIEDDYIGTEKATNRLLNYFSKANKEIIKLSPTKYKVKSIGHFGFFSKKFQTILWPFVLKWFGERS